MFAILYILISYFYVRSIFNILYFDLYFNRLSRLSKIV